MSLRQITWRRSIGSVVPGRTRRVSIRASTHGFWPVQRQKASETGAVTPAAYHDKTPIDPYNMFVGTVASAHMLTWLHMAFSIDVEAERYVDRAYGVLTGLPSGDCWISEVILHPKITLKAGYEMTAATMAHLHEHVPEHCYIARSIKTKVTVRSA
jgi:organic hydroperoxide reductase OsmC/OhrA